MNPIKLNRVILLEFKDSFYNKTINFLFIRGLVSRGKVQSTSASMIGLGM
jgi:hypothetical protein